MTLTDPFWLVLAIPLAMSLWIWPLASRLMTALRCVALLLVVLALCGLSLRLPIRSGTVVLVADRSLSMPSESAALQVEAADILHASSRRNPASSPDFRSTWAATLPGFPMHSIWLCR